MPDESRYGRLAAELHAVRALKAVSNILDFECSGDPPDRYTVIFRGRGICRTACAAGHVAAVDQHRIEIRLTAQYPDRPPDIRWLTPLWHPNVGFGGLVALPDIGLQWDQDLGLDLICERLWDVARASYVDLAHSVNPQARTFFRQRHGLQLPIDSRTLRDRTAAGNRQVSSVLRYKTNVASPATHCAVREIMVIDENTPTPSLPIRAARPIQRPFTGEIHYIGDEIE